MLLAFVQYLYLREMENRYFRKFSIEFNLVKHFGFLHE